MPSLTPAKSSGTTFLAILSNVAQEDFSGDELADASANSHADKQTAGLTESHKEFAVLESAADGKSNSRISANTSGGQRSASDEVSFGIRANRFTTDSASTRLANWELGRGPSERTNVATSVGAAATGLPSQAVVKASLPVVVAQPIPVSQLTKAVSPRAWMETAAKPLIDEPNRLIVPATKVSVSSSRPSSQAIPSAVVAQPTPMSDELVRAVSPPALTETASRLLTGETNAPIASAEKITSSSSQQSAQSIPPAVVVHPMQPSELVKAASSRALMESAIRPLASETNPLIAPATKVSVSLSRPSSQANPPATAVQPMPVSELVTALSPRASMVSAIRPLASEANPIITSAARVSPSSSQPSPQANPPAVVLQPTQPNNLASAVSARALTETTTTPLSSETTPLIASAARISASSSQPSAQANPSGAVVQPTPASELAKAVGARASTETAIGPLASETNVLISSAAKVSGSSSWPSIDIGPRANPVLIAFARASVDEFSRDRLAEDGTLAHVEEPGAAIPSSETVSASASQTPAQNAHSPGTSQQAIGTVPAQQFSGSTKAGSNSSAEETNILTPSLTVPIVTAIPAVQIDSSRITSQLSFAATPEQAISGAGLKQPDAKTNADEIAAPATSANTVPPASSPVLASTISPHQMVQPAFAGTSDAEAPGVVSIKVETNTDTRETNVPTVSQAASPSPRSLPSAPASPSGNPIQQTFASAPVSKVSEDASIETLSRTPADETTVPNSSSSKASSSFSPVEVQPRPAVDSIQQATAGAPGEKITPGVLNNGVLKNSGTNTNVEIGAEHPAAVPPMDTPVIDVSSKEGIRATASEPVVDQDKVQPDLSLSTLKNVAPVDPGSPAKPAENESSHAIPAETDVASRGIVSRTAQEISAPEDIAKPQKPLDAAAPRIPAADIPAADKNQKSTTVVANGPAAIETSLAALLAQGAFTGSPSLSTASAPVENENGNPILEGPVKKGSSIAVPAPNPALANAADTGTKQSTETVSRAVDGWAHSTQTDLPSSPSSQADPSHVAEAAPKASEAGPAQPPSAHEQPVSVQAAIPEAARVDRNASSSDAAPLPADRQGAPASIHGDGGEVPATSSINTAKLMQTMGESEMHIGMRSTEFGEISIRTSIAEQQMVTQISLDHTDLSQAISAHVATMQTKLGEDYGLKASIQVHNLGSSLSGESGQSSQREQKAFNGSAQTHTTLLPQAEDASLSLAALVTPGTGDRLDIRA
jgi:hypothetical protein